MDSESSYKSAEIRTFFSDIGHKIEHTPPRDKHAGGIAERTEIGRASCRERV